MVDVCVDSGSPLSVLSPETAASLGVRPDPSAPITVNGVGGPTTSLGLVTVTMTIGSLTHATTFHVFPHVIVPALLGNVDAARFKLTLDFQDNSVHQLSAPLAQPPKLADGAAPCPSSLVSVPANEDQLPSHGPDSARQAPEGTDAAPSSPITKSTFIASLDGRKLFADSVQQIGRIKDEAHNIRLQPHQAPIALRPYRYSEAKRSEIERQVNELLTLGLIRPSHSPWAAPVTLAPKSDGTQRLCIDHRALNDATISYRHPIPLIQDLLDSVGQSRIFTTLDTVCGYWHVELDKESIERSAFVTHSGHYEWLVMPFGLKNAPSTFQRIMQKILDPWIGKGVDVYLDDIVVHTDTEEGHIALLTQVLNKLESEGVRLKKSKCNFLAPEISYLGHIISAGQVRPHPKKVEAIEKFPTPQKVKDVQSFVGLANFYRDFVPDMSRICAPLTKLTKKDVPFEWGAFEQSAFEKVKQALTSSPVLAVHDPTRPNVLTTDASALGLGAVYSQVAPDGTSRVVAFWSRRTNDAESRYAAVELEVLAVVEALEHFRIYLEGAQVSLVTDCAAIRWIKSNKDTSSRLFRWTLRLSTFTFTVTHRAGKSNVVADALSRNPPSINTLNVGALPLGAFAARQHELAQYRITLPSRVMNGAAHVTLNGRRRIVVPQSLIPQVMKICHDDRNHCGTNPTRYLVTRSYWWPNMSKDVTDYVRSCHPCQLVKAPNRPEVGTYQPIDCPEAPNDLWSIDTVSIGGRRSGFDGQVRPGHC